MVYPAVSDVAPVLELYVKPVALFESNPRIYEGVSAVVDAEAAAHSVVDAESGITYPDVSDVAPVDELYVRPVAEFDERPRIYAGVRAVVEAAAAAH